MKAHIPKGIALGASRRKVERMAAAGCLALIAILVALTQAEVATAATGAAIRGNLYCHDLNGYQSEMDGTAPWVRAANTSAFVDRQTVYWNIQVYADTGVGYQAVTSLDNNWVHAFATDTGYTRSWYMANGTLLGGTPPFMYDIVTQSENNLKYWNVLKFFNSNGSFAGSYGFFSAPTTGYSGSDRFGDGYC